MFKWTRFFIVTTFLFSASNIQGFAFPCSAEQDNSRVLTQEINKVFTGRNRDQIEMKISADFFNINGALNLNNSRLKIHLLAKADGTIKKGNLQISSSAVAPFDPVTGISFEVKGHILKIRTFAEYPDIVAIYGVFNSNPNNNFAILPLGNLPPGTNRRFSEANGEFVGLIRPGQRTDFLTTFENQDLSVADPNPNGVPITINGIPIAQAFCGATLQELMTLVGGFQKIQQFGKMTIITTGKSVCTP